MENAPVCRGTRTRRHRVRRERHGALAHGRVAVESVSAACLQSQKGGKEARGGAGVANVQLGRSIGDVAALAFDRDGVGSLIGCAFKAQRGECFEHDASVAAK